MLKLLRFMVFILYIVSLSIITLNLITLKYSFIGDIVFIINIFLLIAVYLFLKTNKNHKIKKIIDESFSCFFSENKIGRIVLIVFYLCVMEIFVFFALALVYQGGAEVIGARYCIVNHGNIIRDNLTIYEYNMLITLEKEVLPCGAIILNTFLLGMTV